MEEQVLGLDEGYGMATGEREALGGTDGGDLLLDGSGIHGIGGVAGEPEEDGAIGAVADAGEGERAEEVDDDVVGALDQAGGIEFAGETESCSHGADGMGAGRADADLEEFEEAGVQNGEPGGRGLGAPTLTLLPLAL